MDPDEACVVMVSRRIIIGRDLDSGDEYCIRSNIDSQCLPDVTTLLQPQHPELLESEGTVYRHQIKY